MTNKKVRVWLIFFVKLLPLVLLIGFMLYFFRHEFPETEDQVSGEYVEYIYYTEDEFNEYVSNADNSTIYSFTFSSVFNVRTKIGNIYFNGDNVDFYGMLFNYNEPDYIRVYSSTSSLCGGFWCTWYDNYVSVHSAYLNEMYFIPNFWIKEVKNLTTYDFDHTNYFDNIVKQFDDFTTSSFNFIDSLNFNDFYDFTVEHLVHNPSPIYHSVFNIMIYEVIVDLMLLLFGAFAFVINWSRKWLEGIYEKW